MSDEVAHGSASPVPAGRVQSAAGAASAAAGSKARGATRQSRAPSSGRYARAAARTRTTGRRRRRRTIRAQAASEDGIADATAPSEPTSEALLHLPTEFVHPTACVGEGQPVVRAAAGSGVSRRRGARRTPRATGRTSVDGEGSIRTRLGRGAGTVFGKEVGRAGCGYGVRSSVGRGFQSAAGRAGTSGLAAGCRRPSERASPRARGARGSLGWLGRRRGRVAAAGRGAGGGAVSARARPADPGRLLPRLLEQNAVAAPARAGRAVAVRA